MADIRTLKKRGPYNRSEYGGKVPRTTNWRRKEKESDPNTCRFDAYSSTMSDHDDAEDSQVPEVEGNIEDHQPHPAHSSTKFADDEQDISCDEEDEISKEPGADIPENNHQPRLYPGARITVTVSAILIMVFALRHQLTAEALQDLLVLIEIHCLSPNFCKVTKHNFYGFFNLCKSPVQKHYFCLFCHQYHGRTSIEECPSCFKKMQSYFMYIPIMDQLQYLMSGLSLVDLQYSTSRKKTSESNIEDIYDGSVYRHYFNNGHFVGTSKSRRAKEIHISLQFNTDGVSIFRSSSYSVWPVYMTINELHPKKRYNSENRLFVGLWFGEKKPIMNVFLKPMVEELSVLYEKGSPIDVEDQQMLLRVMLINIVCDAPAKCLVQNFTQFNGFYGCGCCLTKGSSIKTSIKGSMLSYPYDLSEDNSGTGHGVLRSHISTIEHARDAELGNKSEKGVKGYSVLCDLLYIDLVKSVSIDYMHCVLLGIQKMLLHLWIDTTNKSEPYYIGDYVHVIDDRLKALTPPNLIKRSTRGLCDLKFWKASEFRSFLLFHSVCCLQGIMEDEYFVHYMLLVESIFLLLQLSISNEDLSKAKIMLMKFCAQIDYLYGQRYETYNVHCLLHLVEKVKDLGPLWCQSCFYYEDLNGDLRALFHGTNKVELQIATAVVIHQQLPFLLKQIPTGSESEVLYHRLTNITPSRNRTLISNNTFMYGQTLECELLPSTRKLIEDLLGPVTNVFQFFRLIVSGVMFHSRLYQNVTKRNSYTVEYTINGTSSFGQIQFFLKVDQLSTGKSKYLAVLQTIENIEDRIILPSHFKEVHVLDKLIIIETEQISEMSYYAYVQNTNKSFVGKIPGLHQT